MNNTTAKQQRARRIRGNTQGTKDRPRLSVHRSNNGMYVQIIDDVLNKTILGVSTKHLEKKETTKKETGKALGILLAKKALEKKIKKVVFDKGPYKYHGRVKSVAEGAREGGLEF